MAENKTYWQGFEQLTNDPEFIKNKDNEFPEVLPEEKDNGPSRRDFLKMMGFGVAAATMAACEAPIRKAIPYVEKPVDVDPGIPNYYASTFSLGGEYSSVVVKTREGRPIKLEGNKLSPVTKGAISAQVEASVLTLYDKERVRTAQKNGEDITWQKLDEEVTSALQSATAAGKKIALVSYPLASPTTSKVIGKLKEKYPNLEYIAYDPLSLEGIRKANEQSFGTRAIPTYHFDKAKTIVSFGADFLGTWITPEVFARDYATGRRVSKKSKTMSRHFQFEGNLSLSGANADYRGFMAPSQEGRVLAELYNMLASKAGKAPISVQGAKIAMLEKAARDLWTNRGSALVVSGSNDPDIQLLVNAINDLLGNYGKTLDLTRTLNHKEADGAAMKKFVAEAGSYGAVIFHNCNPVYDHYQGAQLKEALGKADCTITVSDRRDETAVSCTYQAPDHHFLESWNDFEPVTGHFSLSQPAIKPLFNTRQAQDTYLTWAGVDQGYYDFLRGEWGSLFDNQNDYLDFQTFWDSSLKTGVYQGKNSNSKSAPAYDFDVSSLSSRLNSNYREKGGNELVLYAKSSLGSGYQGNNPWLQEMPDPITKATWENYLTVSIAQANEWGLVMNEGRTRVAKVTIGDQSIEVPVCVQPGQATGTYGLALGFGRTHAGRVGNGKGINAYPFIKELNGTPAYFQSDVTVELTSKPYQLAMTQTHNTYMGRNTVIQETVLEEYQKDPFAGRHHPKIATKEGQVEPRNVSLWKGHEYPNHHWGMAIDLNSCIGCGTCTVACQVENNVPVVGKEEVYRRRDMHWLRIDRYYSSKGNPEDKSIEGLRMLEKAAANPEVTFQPVMCQQCNNAPCETVCPVVATTHSSEGLNQMTYNRCIGTRYCANNCPYKVRRFNWFKYHDNAKFENSNVPANDDLGKMVLNPDVTVRSRGVMEKCTFCVQRLQAGKLKAKKEKRKLQDDDATTACAAACPTEAIVFGDMNNPDSNVSRLLKMQYKEGKKRTMEPRAFHMLEEIRVEPNVFYFTKIRNKDKEDSQA